MGYRIDYCPVKKIRGAEKRRAGLPALTAACLLVFVLLVNCTWPKGSDVLRSLLFSGDLAVTASALEDFAVELRMGEQLQSALESFCRKVVQESEIASG